ncbi:MAG TPA: patatin-like phospholipase family protein, partial [Aquirhabdus sp.]
AGSSMGAVVAAAVCNRSDAELDLFFSEQMETIHRQAVRWRSPRAMRQHRTVMDERQLLENIIANVGSATFSEAYQRSGRILNITISPTRTHQKPRVLNYMTAPNVLVEYAVLASCAVPLLFPPVALQARGVNGRQVPYMSTETWIDGAMRGDLPQDRLARLHNINQTIVSQANPLVIPFITHRQQRGVRAFGKYVLASVIHTGSAELLGMGRQLFGKTRLSPVLDRAHAIAAQNYLGDINIRFPFKPKAYLKVIATPTAQGLADYIRLGEHATWPQIPMIHDLTRISRVFLECIATIQTKMDQTAQVEDGF